MLSSPFARLDALIAPAPAAGRVAFLCGRPFAHRGLHGQGIVENSPSAFRGAIDAGHGIECDVRLSRDGEAFVFHDATLDRLAGRPGAMADMPAAALDLIRLTGTQECLPRLHDVLALVRGRVPLLIEAKAPDRRVTALCLAIFRALDGYRGPVGVMSFNPEVARWFRLHGPRITRGLVVTEQGERRRRGSAKRHLALWRARPDFLAYDIRDLPSRFAAAQRKRGLPVLTWTVRGAADEARAQADADEIIYERA